MSASELRASARQDLAGRWLRTICATLVTMILGGSLTFTGSDVFINFNGKLKGFAQETYMDMGLHRLDDEMILHLIMLAMPLIISGTVFAVIISFARFIVGSFMSLGLVQYNIDLIDKKDPEFSVIFSKADMVITAVLLRLRKTIFELLWSLLFIVPGIIKRYSYSMSGFVLSENPEISAKEAMEVSMDMMNGNKMRMFILDLTFLGWDILAAFSFGIGYIWLIPYKNATLTEFYNDISKNYQRLVVNV